MSQSLLARQPLLDKDRKIVGYELFYRASENASRADVEDDLKSSATVLVNILSDFGSKWLLEGKPIFISATAEMLSDDDFLSLIPPGRIVLGLRGEQQITPELLAACEDLRKRQIGLALDGVDPSEANLPLLKLASHLDMDLKNTDSETLVERFIQLRKLPAKLVAKKIEDGNTFKFCDELGFDYFQGYYFSKPEVFKEKAISPSQGNLIQLLNLLNENADVKEIEAVFKYDPALMVKLLNYVNCAAVSSGRQIKSIGNAITVIGYSQLYRWVALLIYTSGDTATPPSVIRSVLTRSRFMELLGKLKDPSARHDNLFIVGMLSMLDQILETPLPKVLEKMQVAPVISEALLKREGVYGMFLTLAESCENQDFAKLNELAVMLGLDPDGVNRAQLEAIGWAEQLELPGM